MQPVLNRDFTSLKASTISGRRSPDSSGNTSLPRTSAPSASNSAANSRSKVSMSTSARSNFAQAFCQWLAALVRRMISAGSPRSFSKRAKASNGEVVSTPPKSQITASIIISRPANAKFAERLTRCPGGDQPAAAAVWPTCRVWRGLRLPVSYPRRSEPRFRLNRNRGSRSLFGAFSSREPVSTSLENAEVARKCHESL